MLLRKWLDWLCMTYMGQIVLGVLSVPFYMIWWSLLTSLLVTLGFTAINLVLIRAKKHKST